MSSPDKIVVYRARDGWRWHQIAANNRKVAESGEAYNSKAGAEEAAARQASDHAAFVEVEEGSE